MSVKVQWTFAAILCACTLVALWVTAARVKSQKLAARRGERIETPLPAPERSEIRLKRGERLRVEHFSLLGLEGGVAVLDAKGEPLVDFTRLKKGQLRRWQELQLTVLEVGADFVTLETELQPGAPCFGSGEYRALRPGLQVLFDGGRSLTIVAWDPVNAELTMKGDAPWKLQKDPDGRHRLLLDIPD